MLREFAVEPALLGDWHNFHYLHEKFGVPRARLISEFPKKWRRMVYEAAGNFSERQRAMLEVWLADRESFLVPSGRAYPCSDDWLQSAETAHAEKPFHAMLARENPRGHPSVLSMDCYFTENHPLFSCARECAMPKNVDGYIAVTHSLLQCSREVIFVDPYFKAVPKWGEPLRAMFKCIAKDITLLRYCIGISPSGESQEYRIDELRKNLPRYIPKGLSLEVVLLDKSLGRDTHNRFILTERGGLKLPWGLDMLEGAPEDTVNIMEKETHRAKFTEYSSLVGHAIAERLTIVGEAQS